MYCSNCGKENSEDSLFCAYCGAALEHEDTTGEVCQKRASVLKPVLGIAAGVLAVAGIGFGIWYFQSQSAEEAGSVSEKMQEEDSEKETREAEEKEAKDDTEEEAEEGKKEADEEISDKEEREKEAEEDEKGGTVEENLMLAPEEPKEHRYEMILEDCTWDQARQKCLDRGGYLVRIETEEEFDLITSMLNEQGLKKKILFIGLRRETDGNTYCWINRDNRLAGPPVNAPESPMNSHWLAGEPSFQDQNISEDRVNMFYYEAEGRWVMNDAPNAIIDIIPSYSGKIGYICEYEE